MPGARDHTELEVWQLSDEVRVRIYRVCGSPEFRTHLDLSRQLMDAADSACSNIAEGFGRFYPREFARFLRISKGSLAEVADRLRGAVLRGLVDRAEADSITQLTHRARGASTRLIQYLESRSGPRK